MMGRIFAASLMAVFGNGSMLASAEAFAKPAGISGKPTGLVARHALPFRGGFPRRSVFLPPVVPPFNVINASAVPNRVFHPMSGYRRAFGYGLPAAGVGVYYGSYSIPLDDAGEYVQPAFAISSGQPLVNTERRIQSAEYRRGCTSQAQMVPSEDGGERRVTVMRC